MLASSPEYTDVVIRRHLYPWVRRRPPFVLGYNVMQARHPAWFREDLDRLFGLQQLNRRRPPPRSFQKMAAPRVA